MQKDDGSNDMGEGQDEGNSGPGEDYPATRYPGQNDLLLGRGGETNNHSGNIKFRRLLEEYKAEYRAAAKGKKPLVSKKLVRHWRSMRGRFLAKSPHNEDLWEDIGDEAAWRRCSKSLGEQKGKRSSVAEPPASFDSPAAVSAPGLSGETLPWKRKREGFVLAGSPAADRTGYSADDPGASRMDTGVIGLLRSQQGQDNTNATNTHADHNTSTSNISHPTSTLSGTHFHLSQSQTTQDSEIANFSLAHRSRQNANTPSTDNTNIGPLLGPSSTASSARIHQTQQTQVPNISAGAQSHLASIGTSFENSETTTANSLQIQSYHDTPLILQLLQQRQRQLQQQPQLRNAQLERQRQQEQQQQQETKLSEELPTAEELAGNVFSDSSSSDQSPPNKQDSPDNQIGTDP